MREILTYKTIEIEIFATFDVTLCREDETNDTVRLSCPTEAKREAQDRAREQYAVNPGFWDNPDD